MAHIPTDEYVPGAWNAICDRCGRKRKSTELRKTWDNLYVCPEHWEPRHPQDFVRSRVDQQAPDWIRPPGGCPPLCPVITLAGTATPALGVPGTYYYSGTQVTYDREYTLVSSVAATMEPESVTIGPGATTGSVEITFTEEGPQVLYLVAEDGCETSAVEVSVGPGGPAPVADFYGLIKSGTADYDKFVGFDANGVDSLPFPPGSYAIADEAITGFLAVAGAGVPQTWESLAPTGDSALSQAYTDTASGVGVTVSAPTGRIQEIAVGTTDGGGRFSVGWFDGASYFPADGGTKILSIQTNGQTVTIELSEPVASFGLYLIDYLDFGGGCTWNFFRNSSFIYSEAVNPDPLTIPGDEALLDGSVGFISFIARTTASLFDKVTLVFGVTGSDRTGLDNIFVAKPEQRLSLTISLGAEVQFTDVSENTPTSWLWDFGDGTTSTEQNPSKTYGSSGTYTVTLTATNGTGSSTKIKTDYINVV